MRRRAVAVVFDLDLQAGGAENIVFRHGHANVIHAVVGKEFGIGVELMAVPLAIDINADLGEPLANEEIFFFRAGARKRRLRQLGGEINANDDGIVGPERLGERQPKHGPVIGIAVVGLNKFHAAGQIFAGSQGDFVHLDKSPAVFVNFIAAADTARFFHEG